MQTVHVLTFAAARDLTGVDAITMQLELPIEAAALLHALKLEHPELAALIPHCRLAINQSYAPDHQLINGSEELALIPPVSGG